MKGFNRWSSALVLCVWLALPAQCQNSAEVRGKVTDANHQPVVSAFVVITAEDTSVMRAATTDDAGAFEFTSLPIGTYDLQVKTDAFQTFEARGVRASIGQVVNLDLILSLKQESAGSLHQGNPSMIEAGNAQLGVVMGDLEVTQLPLKSRDTFDLLQLQPGVQGTLGADLFFGNDHAGVVSVNGGRSRSNNSSVNGGNAAEEMTNAPSLQPSPDSISEFRVITHNYDAASGRNAGSVLNVRSRHYINLIVAGKQPQPQWLTMDEAVAHCTTGLSTWKFASNDDGGEPDVVMACCGDVPTLETLAAVTVLRQRIPDLRIRVVNVVDLMALQPQSEHPHGLADEEFDLLFTRDKPVIFAFHGYPWVIHRLTYRRHNHDNIHVRGYKEEGTTTTPFDMCVLNNIDRFQLTLDAITRVPRLASQVEAARQWYSEQIQRHKLYVAEHGDDLPEIRNWRWAAE